MVVKIKSRRKLLQPGATNGNILSFAHPHIALKQNIMRKLFLLPLVILMMFTACNAPKEQKSQFQVFAVVKDFDGNQIKLQRRLNDAWVVLDSTLVENGQAVLKGELDTEEMVYLSLQDVRGMVPFFAEPADINVELDPSNLREAVISGSGTHQRFLDFTSELEKFDELLYQHYQAYKAAEEAGNEEEKAAADEAYNTTESEKKSFLVDYIMQHNADVVSHYLLHRNSYQFELDELEAMVVNFDLDVQSSYLEALRDRVLVLKSVAVGMPFKDFEQEDPDSNLISLSSKVGAKVLLVDFWASWCAPCRVENPHIVAVHNDYKDKGFDVFGVSFDTNKEKWLEAIAADKLDWTQVSDLQGWGNAAGKLYGVQSIPHSVLLDENGTIIAKNLRGDDLRQKVAELLD